MTKLTVSAACTGVVAIRVDTELLEDKCCCKSSAGIVGTGFLLTTRTLDATGLTLEDIDDAGGPRQRFSGLQSNDESLAFADMLWSLFQKLEPRG